MSGPYRVPWLWGNSKGRDHVNYAIRNNYSYNTTVGVDERADPDFDTLDKIMCGLWRAKTFEVTWSYSASGTIDLFSHPIGTHTPWSFSFSGSLILTRRYIQDPKPTLGTDYTTVDDERRLFGRFTQGDGSTTPLRDRPSAFATPQWPLGTEHFYRTVLTPTSAGAIDSGGFGLVPPIESLGRLNWRTSGTGSPVLEIIARSVAFSGVPAQIQIPFFVQDIRDYQDPADGSVIVQSGVSTNGQANPAVEIGDATFDMADVSISRKCYRWLSAVTNRGFTIDPGTTGSVGVTATEFFPFADSNGDPIYDTATGAQLRDPLG